MARRGPGRPRKKRRDYYIEGEDLPKLRLAPNTKRGIMVVVFFLLAILTLLAFFEQAGAAGEIIGKVSGLLLGSAALVAPLIFFGMGLALIINWRRESEDDEEVPVSNLRIYLGSMLFTLALTGILHLIAMRPDPSEAFNLVKKAEGGGYLGVLAAFPLNSLFGFGGSLAILVGLFIASIVMVFNINLIALFRRSREFAAERGQKDIGNGNGEIKINTMQPNFNVEKVSESNEAIEEDEQEETDPLRGSGPAATTDIKEEMEPVHMAANLRKGNW